MAVVARITTSAPRTAASALSTMVMGAEGVQVGSRFVTSIEASSHTGFKQAVVNAKEGDTMLTMKQLTPVRMIKNKFFEQVQEAERKGVSPSELESLLGRARAKKGMFEGNLDEGELEIGQVSALLDDILPAAQIVKNLWDEFRGAVLNPLRIQ